MKERGQAGLEYILVLSISVSLALIVGNRLLKPVLQPAWERFAKNIESTFTGGALYQKIYWKK